MNSEAMANNSSRSQNNHQWNVLAFFAITFCLAIPTFIMVGILTNSPSNEAELSIIGPINNAAGNDHQLRDIDRPQRMKIVEGNNKNTNKVVSNSNRQNKPIKRTYNQTSFPGFSKTITTVRCGGHSAPTCAECPNGNGAAWCNGDCEWDGKSKSCGTSSKLAHIHPDYFKIIQRYAFQPVVTNLGEYVNVIMVRAPFREADDEALYHYYEEEILFLGISSFESFPLTSPNPYSAEYESSYYLNMFPGFLHMMHQPAEYFPSNVKTILMSQSDFNLDDPYFFGQRQQKQQQQQQAQSTEILYDFVYSGGDQDVETDCVGWASYYKNFSFVREALEVMCSDEFNVTGVLVANKNKANTKACTIPSSCDGKIVQTTFLDQRQFFTYLSQARWAFLPQVCDASPRVSTQALSMNKPLLMNRNIMGGWKYLLPGVTGEQFNDIHDFRAELKKILDNTRGNDNPYTPLEFVRENYGDAIAGVRLLEFVVSHWGDRIDLPDGTKFLVPTGD